MTTKLHNPDELMEELPETTVKVYADDTGLWVEVSYQEAETDHATRMRAENGAVLKLSEINEMADFMRESMRANRDMERHPEHWIDVE